VVIFSEPLVDTIFTWSPLSPHKGLLILTWAGPLPNRHLLPPPLLGWLDWRYHVRAWGRRSSWIHFLVTEDGGARFFWCCGWRSSWPAGNYIDKTANRKAAGHTPRNPCPLRRALGHKKTHVVTRRHVTIQFYSKYQMPYTPMSCSIHKKTMNCSYFY
jgi:hypothetical protein